MSIDPRVTAFRDSVVRVLQARPIDLDADLEDRADGPSLTLATAWCEERANQLAVVLQGFLAESTETRPIDEAGGGDDPALRNQGRPEHAQNR